MKNAKKIVVGVTGGIAAYKALDLVSALIKMQYDVTVIMTEEATKIVAPLAFEALTHKKCILSLFDEFQGDYIPHITIQDADLFIVVPATANIIAKMAIGLADDALSTALIATKAKVLVCPAMNSTMFLNKKVQENIKEIIRLGYNVLTPISGMLACGVEGIGKLPSIDNILLEISKMLYSKKDFNNKNVLITIGGTQEDIDSVRVIGNKSSGKMGLALAIEAYKRGANVTIVKGNVKVDIPEYLGRIIEVKTTNDMRTAVLDNLEGQDFIIKAAAPADYCVKNKQTEKIKNENVTLELVKNPDIAKEVGERKNKKQKLIIFSAETSDLIENAKKKLASKNADMVVANDVTLPGAGFNCDTNIVQIFTAKNSLNVDIKTKQEIAEIILDEAIKI